MLTASFSRSPCNDLTTAANLVMYDRPSRRGGLPTAGIDGSYLSIFTDSSAVLAAMEDLIDRIDLGTSPDLA